MTKWNQKEEESWSRHDKTEGCNSLAWLCPSISVHLGEYALVPLFDAALCDQLVQKCFFVLWGRRGVGGGGGLGVPFLVVDGSGWSIFGKFISFVFGGL